jgi:hypothetical protein
MNALHEPLNPVQRAGAPNRIIKSGSAQKAG